MAEKNEKVRYINPESGAVFVPNVDAESIKAQVKAGAWRPATNAEVSAFLKAHAPQESKPADK